MNSPELDSFFDEDLEAAGWIRSAMTDPPPYVNVNGDFTGDNMLFVSARAHATVRSGRFARVVIGHQRASPPSGTRIFLDAAPGEVRVNVAGNNVRLRIGECRALKLGVTAYDDTTIVLDDGTSSNGLQIFAENADVHVGSDCMISSDVLFQAGDQHGIVDLASGDLMNQERRRLTLGDHVWLGRRTVVLADAAIGDGCILGSGAVVAKDIPRFSAAVGNPARVVRSEVTWSRSASGVDKAAQGVLDRWREENPA